MEWKTLLTGETTERLEVSLLAATFGSQFWTSLFDRNYGGNFDGNLEGIFDGNLIGILMGILMMDSMGWPYDSSYRLLFSMYLRLRSQRPSYGSVFRAALGYDGSAKKEHCL